MYFSRSVVLSALLGLGAATTHAGEGASSIAASETLASTATAAAASTVAVAHPSGAVAPAEGGVITHVIQVGGATPADLIFSPDNIQANPGELVQFQFNPKNHSVVQSTFDNPCVPIQNIMRNKTDAFFSGFMPAAAANATGEKLTYTIRVVDTKPIWYYCSQAMHCQGGMVGSINAPPSGERTLERFKELAKAAPENLSPGQVAGQSPAPVSSGVAAPSGAVPTGGALPTGTDIPGVSGTGSQPAQQTTNAAGRLSQSLFGLGLGALAAVMLL